MRTHIATLFFCILCPVLSHSAAIPIPVAANPETTTLSYEDYYDDDYYYDFVYSEEKFNIIDTNQDGKVTFQEFLDNVIQRENKTFQEMDANGDGSITVEEETDYAKWLDLTYVLFGLTRYDRPSLGGNGDHKIQLGEFTSYCQDGYDQEGDGGSSSLGEYFSRWDQDGDGSWDIDEMKAYLYDPHGYFSSTCGAFGSTIGSMATAEPTGSTYPAWPVTDSSSTMELVSGSTTTGVSEEVIKKEDINLLNA